MALSHGLSLPQQGDDGVVDVGVEVLERHVVDGQGDEDNDLVGTGPNGSGCGLAIRPSCTLFG
jgi:hypothetical protein